MHRVPLVILATLLGLAAPAPAGEEAFVFPRHAAPSPDGSQLAFDYQGDVWVAPARGGAANRITVHPAHDARPCWSPDGRWIAFDSDRAGNDDVYVVKAGGGEVRRVTVHSSSDSVCGWSRDGREVYFTSTRPETCFLRPLLYRAALTGGMPRLVCGAEMREPALSPDGSCVAFVRGAVPWWRRGYRGSAEMKIWLVRPEGRRYGPLVEDAGNHRWPLWGAGGRVLFYASDAEGIMNLWRYDLQTLEKKRLTGFTEFGVRFPSMAADGSVLAFTAGPHLYTLRPEGGAPRRVEVFGPLDRRTEEVERRTFTSDAVEFALPGEGNDVVFSVRGEGFALELPPAKDDGTGPGPERRAVRLTRSAAREEGFALSPDGTRVVFASDRGGNWDLFLAASADPREKRLSRTLKVAEEALAASEEDETAPAWSPDGTRVAFRRGLGTLVVAQVDGGAETTVVRGWNLESFHWSPDGRWFVFAREDDEYNSDVFLVPADGSAAPLNLSQHPDDDRSPAWFPNGRGIVFSSKRNRDDFDVWMAFLREDDFEADARVLWERWTGGGGEEEEENGDGDEEGEGEDGETGDQGKDGRGTKRPVPDVVVDRKDLHLRLRQLTSLPGDETGPAVSPDSISVAFFGSSGPERALWKVCFDGSGLETVSAGLKPEGDPCWDAKGKEVFFLDRGGRIRAVSAKGGKQRAVDFEAVLDVDHRAERRQMFHECWRLMDRHFYDAGFHGADWPAARARYEPLALGAASPVDFCDAVNLMLGELNASHMGVSPPRNGGGEETGSLGVDLDADREGPGLRIEAVLARGPAARAESRLVPGDVLLEAGGVTLGPGENLHRVLEGTAGSRVLLRVAGPGGQEREVVIRPFTVQEEWDARYEAWMEGNRRRVDAWSRGRFAYLHVQGMGWGSFERFERELYSLAQGKEGLVLDVRNNGGGWTADMLLTVLAVKPHALTRSRGGGMGYPQGRRPFYAWTKPAALLCNEFSFSNAEIFSHAFKTLRRGPLVGRPTFGGVISTGGRRLLDGSWIRMPTRGWWVHPDGPDMELNGAVPDHDVPLTPEDEETGADPQLKRAVEALLGK